MPPYSQLSKSAPAHSSNSVRKWSYFITFPQNSVSQKIKSENAALYVSLSVLAAPVHITSTWTYNILMYTCAYLPRQLCECSFWRGEPPPEI